MREAYFVFEKIRRQIALSLPRTVRLEGPVLRHMPMEMAVRSGSPRSRAGIECHRRFDASGFALLGLRCDAPTLRRRGGALEAAEAPMRGAAMSRRSTDRTA